VKRAPLMEKVSLKKYVAELIGAVEEAPFNL
jgi:hypothetical protein